MSGSSQLTLELTDIVINGAATPLLTSTYTIKGKGEGKKTARKVVGGAGLGMLIGGIAGGGAGAAIERPRWCCRWNGSCRFQERRAAADPQRIVTRVQA
jgi:hypothetical protein